MALFCAAPVARAESRKDDHSDHYAGLQLAPTIHAGFAHGVFFAGAGVELSFQKWLLLELALSGQTAPIGEVYAHDVPGALHTSIGLYSRAGGGTHTFVYGVGMSYSNRYECPRYCTVFAAIAGPEEHRAALDLLTADVTAGYEARLGSGFFLRGTTRVEIPVYVSDFVTRDDGEVTSLGPGRHGKFFLLSIALQLTVGYAFTLQR